MPFAVWITGLPGCGKSTIAKELAKLLGNVEYLRLDELRKKYIKDPKFTDKERDLVYSMFIDDGVARCEEGKNVIFDATGNKLKWRNAARRKIKNIIEAYVKCPVEVCMARESHRSEGLVLADLYKKALERKKTGKRFKGLGEVVGVDVPYEENNDAEVVIDSQTIGPKEAAVLILNEIKKKGWA